MSANALESDDLRQRRGARRRDGEAIARRARIFRTIYMMWYKKNN